MNQQDSEPNGKNRLFVTVGIILGLAVVILSIIFLPKTVKNINSQETITADSEANAGNFDIEPGNNSPDIDGGKEPGKNDLAYTKGTFDGATYTNEWADMKFTLPYGFTQTQDGIIALPEAKNLDIGGYFSASDNQKAIYFAFEETSLDELEYFDYMVNNSPQIQGESYIQSPVTPQAVTVGGYTYTMAKFKVTLNSVVAYEKFYLRKADNRMIIICTVGLEGISDSAMLKQIAPIK